VQVNPDNLLAEFTFCFCSGVGSERREHSRLHTHKGWTRLDSYQGYTITWNGSAIQLKCHI